MEIEKLNNNWKLRSIRIDFKNGYDWKEDSIERQDRYEGMIQFENDDQESFSFKVKADMAQKYIDLIANDIVISANGLGEKLKESLNLK